MDMVAHAEINNLSFVYADENEYALQHISLSVQKGEFIALAGGSGSGKTTIINILTKQLTADSGECYVQATSNEIGLMLDEDGLYSRLSCLDNLIVFEDIYGIPRKRTKEALERVGLSDAANKSVSQLSKGMRQRLALARAVLHRPKVIFLDEPTSALDPVTARGIHELINDLRQQGATIFLTTHNMEEAANLCDQIVLLHKGTIVEQGTPKEICDRYKAVKTVMDLESVFIQLTGEGLS